MIARLASTPAGPELRRLAGRTRGRRALVVVDRTLYAPEVPARWPSSPGTDELLLARAGGVSFVTRREIEHCCRRALPGWRIRLLPRDLLPREKRGLCRARALRRRRFRRFPDRERRGSLLAIGVSLLLCALIAPFACRLATRAEQTIAEALETAAERQALDRRADALRVREADLLRGTEEAGSERSLSPGRLVDALVAVTGNDERFSLIDLDGDRLTLVVVTRDPGVPARVGAIAGIRLLSHSIDRRGEELVATVHTRIE